MPQPMAKILLPNRDFAHCHVGRMSTAGAAHAPRCLNRKPTIVVREQTSESRMPRIGFIKDSDLEGDEADLGLKLSFSFGIRRNRLEYFVVSSAATRTAAAGGPSP